MKQRYDEFSGAVRSLRLLAAIAAAALLGSLMTACTGWPGPYGSVRHFNKDNPFDRAVATFSESDMVAVARRGLLNRFPIGTPTAELRRYLRSIGGSCERKSGGPLVCMYSQYFLLANRGIVGDEWREYRYHDFTIRVWPDQGPIARLTVCDAIVRETERGPMLLGNPHDRSRESAFKPCV